VIPVEQSLWVSVFYMALFAWSAFNFAVMLMVYFINADVVALIYSALFGAMATVLMTNSLIRSPDVRVDLDTLFVVQRTAWAILVICGAAIVDVYLAEHNGHLSIIRRVVRFWEQIPGRISDDGT
jgi:hypothetical protein